MEAKKLLEGMKSGKVLQLVTDGSAASEDVALWSRVSSIEFLPALEMSSGAQSSI
jgi:TusA-related sulfurtransferase